MHPTKARSTVGVFRQGWTTVRRVAANDILLAGLALAVLVIIFFYDVVFLERTVTTSSFQPGVMGMSPPFGYPEERPPFNPYQLDSLASAEGSIPVPEKMATLYRDFQLPLWDANLAMGRPIMATLNPNVISPIRIPLAVWPSSEMWDAFLIIRLVVAGVFTYLLAKRLRLAKTAAFGAAVAFALSGQFMFYIDTPHTDMAMMIPVLLYAMELLLERADPRRMAFVVGAIALGILADNPEAGAVLLLYGVAYYLARALAEMRRQDGFHFWSRIPPLGLALGAGVGLTAFALVPFFELSGLLGFDDLSTNTHTVALKRGLQFAPLRFLMMLFIPFFNGAPLQTFQGTSGIGAANYVGMLIPALALIGLWNRPAMGKAGWFFLGAAVILVAKFYGVPLINWVGQLPILVRIGFGPYLSPAIGFSLAMMAGLGLDQICRGGLRQRHLLLAGLLVAALLGWLVWTNWSLLESIPKSHLLFYMFVGVGLAAAGLAAGLGVRRGWLSARVGTALVIVFIIAELFIPTLPVRGDLGFVTSELYGRHLPIVERPLRHDPFTEPPYVSFLKEDKSKHRVLGLDYLLFPNASMAYGIDDIRGFSALTVERYLNFIQEFIQPTVRQRFVGTHFPPLNSEQVPPLLLDNNMFDLLNVKYVITRSDLAERYERLFINEVLIANDKGVREARSDIFRIDGDDEAVLFQHPPSSLSYTFTPSADSRFLNFRLALDPRVWSPDLGDGVLFEVSLLGEQTSATLFSRWVDPKNGTEDRRWVDGSVDLSSYIGQSITLELSTQPGESSVSDWAGWGGLRLADSPEEAVPNLSPGQFDLVYDKEVKIYRNNHVFPRAFVVHQAQVVSGVEEAIARMKTEEFDPAQVAVIEGDVPLAQLAALADGQTTGGSTVEITKYQDQLVELRVTTERAGFLILSDTYYPGWKAYVDGKQVPIYPTDVTIRSVFLEPGEHEVRFEYSPGSFKLGVVVSGLSLLALGTYAGWGTAQGLWARRRERRRSGQPSGEAKS